MGYLCLLFRPTGASEELSIADSSNPFFYITSPQRLAKKDTFRFSNPKKTNPNY